MESRTEELKKKIESILFAAGKKIEISEIAKLCRLSHNIELVEKILKELKKKYEHETSSLMLVQEGTAWKLTVRERYVSLVQGIVKHSELSRTIVETLAVVAYKAPVLQSELIKIRTNKAYDHLRELEHSGYITREKKGRTKLIKLTPKFFEYFDVPPEKIKEKFKTVAELEKAVELREAEAKQAKAGLKEKKETAKKTEKEKKELTEKKIQKLDNVIKEKEEKVPEIDLYDKKGKKKKLNVYDSEIVEKTELETPKSNIQVMEEKVGSLDVVELALTPAEKKELIEEAGRLRREEMAEAAKKLGKTEKKATAEEKEKAFEKKFSLFGEKEKPPEAKKEKPAEVPKEKEEKPPEIKKEKVEEKPERAAPKTISEEAAIARKKQPPKLRKGKKLFEKGVPKDIQSKIDERVDEIVFGKKKEEEKKEKKEEKGKTPERY